MLKGLNGDKLNEVSNAVIELLQGQGGSLATVLSTTSSFTQDLSTRDELIGNVIDDLNAVLGTLARKSTQFDASNVFSTFDLTVRRTGESLFTTSKALDPNMKHLDEVVNAPDFIAGAMANLSGQAADPFEIPAGSATQHDAGTP